MQGKVKFVTVVVEVDVVVTVVVSLGPVALVGAGGGSTTGGGGDVGAT